MHTAPPSLPHAVAILRKDDAILRRDDATLRTDVATLRTEAPSLRKAGPPCRKKLRGPQGTAILLQEQVLGRPGQPGPTAEQT